MGIGAGAEDDLNQDQNAECRHRKVKRVPVENYFAIDPLLGEPEQRQESGTDFEHKDRPGLDRTEGERPEHEESESPVEQPIADLSRQLLALRLGNLFRSHELLAILQVALGRFSHQVEVVDPELTTDWTALRKPPDVHYNQLAVQSGGELAIHRLPESGLFHFVAVEVHRLAVHVLNRQVRAAGAFEFAILVIRGEV